MHIIPAPGHTVATAAPAAVTVALGEACHRGCDAVAATRLSEGFPVSGLLRTVASTSVILAVVMP